MVDCRAEIIRRSIHMKIYFNLSILFLIQGAYLRSLKLVACLYNTVFPDKGNYARRFLPQATSTQPSNTPPTLTYIVKQQVV